MRTVAVLGLFFMLQSAGAAAQEPVAPKSLFDLSLEELGSIEVIDAASKRPQLLGEAPGSDTIVTRDEIRAYGYRTLADILQAERSFYTIYDRNYIYPGVRGVARPTNGKRVLVLVDGHRVNENYYEQAFLGTAFPVDVELIQRVEIVRGPNSALYGTNAMMAVINVVTGPPEAGKGLEAAALVGSQDTGKLQAALAGGSEAKGEWLLSGSYYRSDGEDRLYYREFDAPATNDGLYLDNDGDEALRLFGRYAKGGLTVGGYFSSREKRIPTSSYETMFNAPGTFSRDQLGHLDVVFQTSWSDQVDYYGSITFDRFFYTGDYIYDYPPVTINRDETRVNTLSSEQRVGWRHGRHQLLAGFELRDDYSFEGLNFDVEPYALYVENRGDSQILGLFLQDEIAVGRRLNLTVGARYDEYFGLGGSFNPRLGAVFSPRSRTKLRLLAGQAYRAPNKTELEDAGPWRDSIGVGPERLQSFEFVWEEYLRPTVRVSASAHHHILSDLISLGPVTATTAGYRNEPGDISVSGAEFMVDYGAAGGWRAQGSAGYTGGATDNSAISANSPDWLFKARVASPVLFRRWRLGVQGMHMGARPTVRGATVPAYDLVHATLQYVGLSGSGWVFALSAYNLFDADYADPGTENHRQVQLEQDPLTLQFKVTCAY